MFRKLMSTLAACAVVFFATTGFAFAAIDVNSADATQLQTIKGIGPAISAKIIAERKNGAFKDWGDLEKRVSGIGDKNSAKFSEAGLTVGGTAKANAPMVPVVVKDTPKAAPKSAVVAAPVPPSADKNAKTVTRSTTGTTPTETQSTTVVTKAEPVATTETKTKKTKAKKGDTTETTDTSTTTKK